MTEDNQDLNEGSENLTITNKKRNFSLEGKNQLVQGGNIYLICYCLMDFKFKRNFNIIIKLNIML